MYELQRLSPKEQLSAGLCAYPEQHPGLGVHTKTQHIIEGEPVQSGNEHNTQTYSCSFCVLIKTKINFLCTYTSDDLETSVFTCVSVHNHSCIVKFICL